MNLTLGNDHRTHTVSHKRLERMRQILALLNEVHSVSMNTLTDRLALSKATIRRELAELEEQGLLIRTHGGAVARDSSAEIPVRLRDSQAKEAKVLVARAAALMIPSGPHAIAVSGGTTTHEVVRELRYRHELTVVTNSLVIAADCAANPRLNVIITGGTVRSSSLEAVGPLSEATFGSMNVGTALLGADGISAKGGATTHDDTEARTNFAMIRAAQRVIVVADGSKIGKTRLAKLADLEQIDDLVTDSSADPAELDLIRSAGVAVHLADLQRRRST